MTKRVLIMAGGTGGHVFPALAVAKELRALNVHVEWLGTEKGIENPLVKNEGFPLHFISIIGLKGKNLKTLLQAPLKIIKACLQAIKIIKTVNPDVIIGFGGFVSGPGGLASWLLKRKLIIHEQNAKKGLTNKLLFRFANNVLQGFPNTFPEASKVITTGNPIRKEMIIELEKTEVHQPFRLLILGGSLGAQALNNVAPKALAQLKDLNIDVFHQTGDKHYQDTVNLYKEMDVKAKIVPFVTNIHELYQWADFVICRAGALTIAELCAAGIPSLLIPFPYAADDHQTANAYFMQKNNAALLLPQKEFTVEKLVNILKEYYQSPEKCLKMGRAAFALRRVDATDKVISFCMG